MILFLVIFSILTCVEFILIWFKWNEIQDFNSVGDIASNVLGVNDHYKGIIGWLTGKLIKMKKYIWIPIAIILVLNLFASFLIMIGFYGLKFLIILVLDSWIKKT